MDRLPVPEETVLQLVEIIERAGLPYAFMGGLAINCWGIPRATYDLDATVAVEEQNVSQALAALRGDDLEVDDHFLKGYVDTLAGMKKAAVKLLSAGTWFTVDLFFATTPFLRSVMNRRVSIKVREKATWVITAADLILFKLIAGRRKDWVDIDNVVAVQGIPEREYLESWAKRLGVEQRLAQVLGRG